LAHYCEVFTNRSEAMARAFLSGGYTLKEIGDHFGVHYATMSRAVRRYERSGGV